MNITPITTRHHNERAKREGAIAKNRIVRYTDLCRHRLANMILSGIGNEETCLAPRALAIGVGGAGENEKAANPASTGMRPR